MIDQYLDELEVELRSAAGRRARLAVARAPRPPAGGVAGVLGVAACVLVAFVLLQAGGRHAGGGSSSGSSASPAAVPAGARALVDELGVFRRPQTAADRIDAPIPRLYVLESGVHGGGPQNLTVVPSLTRLVARLPGGRRIYLAIGRVAGLAVLPLPPGFKRPRPSSTLRVGPSLKTPAPHYVVVWLELPFADYVPVPTSGAHRSRMVPIGRDQQLLASPALTASTLLERGQTASPPEGIPDDPITGLMTGPKTWLAIVPDSVARARWSIQYPGQRHRVKVTLSVSNNVALLRVPNGQMDEVWSLTWLAADGHAIQTLSYPVAFQ
ncbi:MAG TPA: hypothetical protein VMA77_13900 [Solirubrobacteraceae bacterium]|nr:hypothetical protein [Solirubrobacteraceae bacterium]